MTPTNCSWLTAQEAAAYLKCDHRTLLSWARQGKVKGYVLSGTQRVTWRFLQADLDGGDPKDAGAVIRRSGGISFHGSMNGGLVLQNDWRKILITLIIRTRRSESNRKQSKFECYGLISTTVLEFVLLFD
jgi:excisionase family DNA binding protein